MINLTKDELFAKAIEIFKSLHNNSVKVAIVEVTHPLLKQGKYVMLTINPVVLKNCFAVVAEDSIITNGSLFYENFGYVSIHNSGSSIYLDGVSIKDFRKFISEYNIPFSIFDFKSINLHINNKQKEVDELSSNLNKLKDDLKKLEHDAKIMFDLCKIPIEFE